MGKEGTIDLLAEMRAAQVKEFGEAEELADPSKADEEVAVEKSTPDVKETTEDEGSKEPITNQLARNEGWMPLEEWKEAGNDPDLWKPAGAFLVDGEVRKELRGLKRAVKKRDKVIDSLSKQMTTNYKAGYDAAYKELKTRRDKAAEDGDIKAVVEISEEIEELKSVAPPSKVQGEEDKGEDVTDDAPKFTPEEQASIRNWAGRNPWYVMDPQLGQYADIVATQYIEENEDVDIVDALQHATQIVRKQFPSRFKGTRSTAAVDTTHDRKGPVQNPEPSVLKPNELHSMENGEYLYGLYKNYKAAGMFKQTADDKKGKWTYTEWAKKIGATKEK